MNLIILCHVGYIKMILKTKQFIIIAIILLAIGVILPLLMVVHVINSSFLLNFISYMSSVIGLFLGSLAVMTFVKIKRDKR